MRQTDEYYCTHFSWDNAQFFWNLLSQYIYINARKRSRW